MQGSHQCSWIGITCNISNGRIMDLNLEQLRLGGTLTLFIGNLSSFSRISFGLNNFIGSIPHEIGLLSSLTYLVLYANYLSGSVPSSIYNKSSLYYFTFTQNHLHGNLPADVGITLPTFKYLLVRPTISQDLSLHYC